jgi:hypothetical protein
LILLVTDTIGAPRPKAVARSFTGAIERGEKDLRITTLVKLANTFRIPIARLFK